MSEGQPPASPAGHDGGVPARAADSDREAAAERLRVAAGEGRIDLTELEDRLERAFGSKTYRELNELLADLPPGQSLSAKLNALPGPETLILDTTVTNINLKQSGRWVVPQRIVAKCTRSLIRIDFTRASCEHREVVVEASCGTGLDHLGSAAWLGGFDRRLEHQHREHSQQGARVSGPECSEDHRHCTSSAWLRANQAPEIEPST
jgi:Domain of unknown function (DUF1707)